MLVDIHMCIYLKYMYIAYIWYFKNIQFLKYLILKNMYINLACSTNPCVKVGRCSFLANLKYL